MIPGSWLLACLLLGAGGAYAVPCTDSGCSLELSMGAIQANDFAHAVLVESGLNPSLVSGEVLSEPPTSPDIVDPFGRAGATNVMLALAGIVEVNIDVQHPAANTGIVAIESSACTLCGQCAKTCPTHALHLVYEDDTVSISFDAKACVNCTQCISVCPEIGRGAISVTGRVSAAHLAAGRQTLNTGSVATCETCGAVIAPTSMMTRIGDLLGDEFGATLAMLENRCLDCRGRR
jgi:ferredoxin